MRRIWSMVANIYTPIWSWINFRINNNLRFWKDKKWWNLMLKKIKYLGWIFLICWIMQVGVVQHFGFRKRMVQKHTWLIKGWRNSSISLLFFLFLLVIFLMVWWKNNRKCFLSYKKKRVKNFNQQEIKTNVVLWKFDVNGVEWKLIQKKMLWNMIGGRDEDHLSYKQQQQ